jgi:glycosyltransferase involved in cell wall biosynthesis
VDEGGETNLNIMLEGLFYNGSGFAEDNRFLLRLLEESGFRVQIVPRDSAFKYAVLDPEEIRYIESFENQRLSSNDIYICNLMGSALWRRPEFTVNIARTGFETDRIPAFWTPNLNAFDEVWLFSHFNRNTFAASGVTAPLKVVPGYCGWIDKLPEGSGLTLPCTDQFVFLSVFDWSDRKGYDVLLSAFMEEFGREDSAVLIIKTADNGSNPVQEVERLVSDKPDAPDIYVMTERLHTKDMVRLYQLCDAFVLPSRGEGWGRPYMEAMLLEMPVISTNWGGQTDFLNETNAFPVEVKELVAIHNHDIPLFNGHCWAEPSIADLRKQMRYVYDHPAVAQERGIRAKQTIAEQFSKKAISETVVRELSKFTGRIQMK